MAASRAEVTAGLGDAEDLVDRALTSFQRILARELARDWADFLEDIHSDSSNTGARGYPTYDQTSQDLLTTLHSLRARIERSESTRK